MENVTVVDHPLVQHKLSLMRRVETPTAAFRQLLREISMLLGFEVTRELPLTTREVQTPLIKMDAPVLADAGLPIWMFGGGKDTTVKPHWLYEMADALQQAGHPALRFTVHENMDHDAWKRVYEGEDLYNWFLRYTRSQRPH